MDTLDSRYMMIYMALLKIVTGRLQYKPIHFVSYVNIDMFKLILGNPSFSLANSWNKATQGCCDPSSHRSLQVETWCSLGSICQVVNGSPGFVELFL